MIDKIGQPKSLYCFARLPFDGTNPALKKDSPVIFSVVTLGSQPSDLVAQEFEKGNHLEALMADMEANSLLFSKQEAIAKDIAAFAKRQGYGIQGVYEAPTDIDASIQDYIVKVTGADKVLGISLTSGHMLCPEKSMCQIYLLSQDKNECNYRHDCSSCQADKCNFRQAGFDREK